MSNRRTPHIVGRYAIYDEIASGGMASVHFARFVGPSGFARTVAAKRAHPHLARDPDFAPMFLDEARLAARIRHSNVVPTLDVLHNDDELVLVMDYVHGESLWRLVRAAKDAGERIPVGIASSILVDALHGLEAAHEATDESGRPLGIVHRDVSPHNILVGVDGVTRLVDFGIAKAQNRLHSTKDHSVRGKYAYMAPEQASGGAVSRLTDTYAAAIVFWELVTGERLFLGKNDAETLHRCMVAKIPPPSSMAPDLPRELDAILRRGLSRTPGERYATAREMAQEIEKLIPAVRASEVGAWVKQIARESLAERERVLAEIEREAAENTPSPELTPTKGTAHIAPAVILNTDPGKGRRRTAWVAAIFVACVAAMALFVTRRSAPSPGDERTPAPSPALIATADPAAPTIAPVPIAADSVLAASASAAPSAAPVGTDAPPAASSSSGSTVVALTPPPSSPSATSLASPVRPAHLPSRPPRHPPKRARACDPPYSIDAEGREIFKPECM